MDEQRFLSSLSWTCDADQRPLCNVWVLYQQLVDDVLIRENRLVAEAARARKVLHDIAFFVLVSFHFFRLFVAIAFAIFILFFVFVGLLLSQLVDLLAQERSRVQVFVHETDLLLLLHRRRLFHLHYYVSLPVLLLLLLLSFSDNYINTKILFNGITKKYKKKSRILFYSWRRNLSTSIIAFLLWWEIYFLLYSILGHLNFVMIWAF